MLISTSDRRLFLHRALGAGLAWAAPMAWAQSTSVPDARLIVVFLRGAYDGLSAFVPHGDAHYRALRPHIALPAPDGTAQTTVALDATFGLHPALAPLHTLWQQRVLACIPCAGSPDPTRSHFEAQHHWEVGIPGKTSAAPGWMNQLAGSQHRKAIGVGEANPRILAGDTPVQLVPRGQAATKAGALADSRTHDAVMRLYAGNDVVSRNFRAGAQSRLDTAQALNEPEPGTASTNAMLPPTAGARAPDPAADNGAGSAKGLQLDAQHLGTLMRRNPALRLGFLSAGGWDTHANQGAAQGALANNLASLAATLVQLRRDFSRESDVVLVMSEFGRTSAENGTGGTDHGHGNAFWLMGNRIHGGRWHGTWSGLAQGNLHEGRDLPVHHDFRAVLAQVLRGTQGVSDEALTQLFPGYAWDRALDGLILTG